MHPIQILVGHGTSGCHSIEWERRSTERHPAALHRLLSTIPGAPKPPPLRREIDPVSAMMPGRRDGRLHTGDILSLQTFDVVVLDVDGLAEGQSMPGLVETLDARGLRPTRVVESPAFPNRAHLQYLLDRPVGVDVRRAVGRHLVLVAEGAGAAVDRNASLDPTGIFFLQQGRRSELSGGILQVDGRFSRTPELPAAGPLHGGGSHGWAPDPTRVDGERVPALLDAMREAERRRRGTRRPRRDLIELRVRWALRLYDRMFRLALRHPRGLVGMGMAQAGYSDASEGRRRLALLQRTKFDRKPLIRMAIEPHEPHEQGAVIIYSVPAVAKNPDQWRMEDLLMLLRNRFPVDRECVGHLLERWIFHAPAVERHLRRLAKTLPSRSSTHSV